MNLQRAFIAVALGCLLLGSGAIAQTPAPTKGDVRIGRAGNDHYVVSFAVPPSNDDDELRATFDFGPGKGFLGPSSNGVDQSGFKNADGSLVGVSHMPATKSSHVHLFLRSKTGDVTVLYDVNERVSKLLTPRWAEPAENFLRIESIVGRRITLQTVDYAHAPEPYAFAVDVDEKGAITVAKTK